MLLGVTGNTDTKSWFGCKTWLVYGKTAGTYLGKWSEGHGEQILLLCLSLDGEEEIVVPHSEQLIWFFSYEINSETVITEY